MSLQLIFFPFHNPDQLYQLVIFLLLFLHVFFPFNKQKNTFYSQCDPTFLWGSPWWSLSCRRGLWFGCLLRFMRWGCGFMFRLIGGMFLVAWLFVTGWGDGPLGWGCWWFMACGWGNRIIYWVSNNLLSLNWIFAWLNECEISFINSSKDLSGLTDKLNRKLNFTNW